MQKILTFSYLEQWSIVIIPICLPAVVVEMRKSLFVEKPQLIENNSKIINIDIYFLLDQTTLFMGTFVNWALPS